MVEIFNMSQIGEMVRLERKSQRVTQIQLAQLANVGVRFIRDIEDGKESIHAGKLLQVLETLGIALRFSLPSGE